jgi:hypothetical protein
LLQGQLLSLDDRHFPLGGRQGEVQARGHDARPGELGEVSDFARVGIRQAHRVAASPVEGALEMDDLGPAFAASGGQVLPNLPVHGGFERVFHREGTAFDEEVTLQRRHAYDARKFMDERGVLHGVNVRIRHFDLRCREEVRFDFRPVKVRVVEADWLRGVKAVQVNQFTAGGRINEP